MESPKDGNSEDGVLCFAYGSNLSLTQMRCRCPSSQPIGLAHLPGWAWLINERGYANIVRKRTPRPALPSNPSTLSLRSSTSVIPRHNGSDGGVKSSDEKEAKEETLESPTEDERPRGVWGVVYRLHEEDEYILDICEGVPWAYEKRYLHVNLFPHPNSGETDKMKTVRVLVYIDFQRVTPSEPRIEYVDRMNRGIKDAMERWGLPYTYVNAIMRPYIPERLTD
ncbi:hypothetical protein F5B19DRAFT_260129 [Rostrohypoxylon terebratum]|nr:hypothetical protein F5B19DRAFT_260129 [Rostrohypoxylon terebratum]